MVSVSHISALVTDSRQEKGEKGVCANGHELEPLGTSEDNGWGCDARSDGGCLSGEDGGTRVNQPRLMVLGRVNHRAPPISGAAAFPYPFFPPPCRDGKPVLIGFFFRNKFEHLSF